MIVTSLKSDNVRYSLDKSKLTYTNVSLLRSTELETTCIHVHFAKANQNHEHMQSDMVHVLLNTCIIWIVANRVKVQYIN